MTRQLTAIVERDGNGYVALCPEVDVASQGDSVAEARSNLKEALALFFEAASTEEIERPCEHREFRADTLRSIVSTSPRLRPQPIPRRQSRCTCCGTSRGWQPGPWT